MLLALARFIIILIQIIIILIKHASHQDDL